MAKKELSIAPKERINIKYVPATGGEQEEIELPLKTVIVGDFTGRDDETPIEQRKIFNVDKFNFQAVMKAMELKQEFEVENVLADEVEQDLMVTLEFEDIKDFAPDSIMEQVPELKKLKDLREALTALKGPLGNLPSFRQALREIVDDEEKRKLLLDELSENK